MRGVESDRREFLKIAGMVGLAGLLPAAVQAGPRAPKNWLWIPNGTVRTQDEWKRHFALLRQCGIDAVLPEIYDGRNAYFASTRLPVKIDWLGMLLPLAHEAGIEVHGWMWSMPCMIPAVMQAHPDWYNVNGKGESAVDHPAYVPYYRFLDPGRPEVRDWVQGTVKELAAIPGLAGIHLDYIRHPDAILPPGLWKKYGIVQDRIYPEYDYGYTEYERARFMAKFGADPIETLNPTQDAAWLQFRCDAVTDLVNDFLVPAAHAGGKQITAAVFPGPTLAREHVRQDWGKWQLDGFLPMLYNRFYNQGPEWVAAETREGVAAVARPVYSGLFLGGMDDAAFARTADLALDAGAAGIALFADDMMNEAKLQALRQRSAGRS